MPVYSEHLRNIIKEGIKRTDGYDTPLRGFHICVDAGNGGGGFFATDVLAPLGADISGTVLSHDVLVGIDRYHTYQQHSTRSRQSAITISLYYYMLQALASTTHRNHA